MREDALSALMDRIIKHIERLLLQHDCVIIPDFGGFVLQSIPSVYLGDEHSFAPARKEIVFNPTLTHNDGLLVESYMQEYSVDFDKAQQFARKDIAGIKDVLSNYSELQLGNIGFFIKEDERLIFMPGKRSDVLFSTRSYGLPVFHFLPLSARDPHMTAPVVTTRDSAGTSSVITKKQGRNVIYSIPVTRTFLRAIAATAATVLLFLFISTPVSDVNKASYTASFVPQEIMPKKTTSDIVSEAFSTSEYASTSTSTPPSALGYTSPSASDPFSATGNASTPASTTSVPASTTSSSDNMANTSASTTTETESSASKSSTSTTTASKSSTSTSTSSASKSSTSKSSSKKTSTSNSSAKTSSASAKSSASNAGDAKYYVIICSFENKTRTQAYIKQLKGSEVAATAGILVRDGRARGYAKSFSNENDANSYMQKLHKNPKHKKAWVYYDK